MIEHKGNTIVRPGADPVNMLWVSSGLGWGRVLPGLRRPLRRSDTTCCGTVPLIRFARLITCNLQIPAALEGAASQAFNRRLSASDAVADDTC